MTPPSIPEPSRRSCGSPPRPPRSTASASSRRRLRPDREPAGLPRPGKIVERLVDTGQTVRRGQPLMRIDAADYALAQAAQDQRSKPPRPAPCRPRPTRPAIATWSGPARCRARPTTRSRPPPSPPAPNCRPPRPRPGCRATPPATPCWSPTPTAWWSRPKASPARSSPPARRSCAWPTPVRARPRSPCPRRCAPASARRPTASVFGGNAASPARLRQISDAADPRTRTFEARYVLDGALASAPLGATVTMAFPAPARFRRDHRTRRAAGRDL
jgi:pyruvate/2-oxoglutarate dehydrogenase complex dihydrolipoamide acyltransferase (E2) component